jgi:glyoxylase-like metal-dependent hydrolase (beta-lactamase superfamily II)
MELGNVELHIIPDGSFKVDGGAAFGVVPKVLWSKLVTPDELNRITIAVNSLLIRTKRKNILVDCGMGDKFSKKQREMWGIEKGEDIISTLADLGVKPGEIDIVLLTHLHFDHVGGATRRDTSGRIVPTFPNALYYVQSQEWEDANHPNERTKATYLAENFLALKEAGQLKLITGHYHVGRGVSTWVTGGHTSAHQMVRIQSKKHKALFLADIIPSTAHIHPAYVPAYDLFPLTVMEVKKRIYQRALEDDWLVIFQHDPNVTFARFKEEGGGVVAVPVAE